MTRLAEAYRLYAGLERRPRLGGVLIAERHVVTGAEHHRMQDKQAAGCEFLDAWYRRAIPQAAELYAIYLKERADEEREEGPL
jgi:hypothetical protein